MLPILVCHFVISSLESTMKAPIFNSFPGPGLGADGSQKRMVGSTVWKFYCGRYVIAAQGLVKPSYKVNGGLQQCLADCAAEPYVFMSVMDEFL